MSNIIQLTNAIIPIEGANIDKLRTHGIYVNFGGKRYKIRFSSRGVDGDKVMGAVATSLDSTGHELLNQIKDNLLVMFYREIKND